MAAPLPGYSVTPQISGYLFDLSEDGWFRRRIWGHVFIHLGNRRVSVQPAKRGSGVNLTVRCEGGTLRIEQGEAGELIGPKGAVAGRVALDGMTMRITDQLGRLRMTLRPHSGRDAVTPRPKTTAHPELIGDAQQWWELSVLGSDGRPVVGQGVYQV